MRFTTTALAVLMILGGHRAAMLAQQAPWRTHTTTYPAPKYAAAEDWQKRAAYLREHVLASAGLLPLPERTALRPVVSGEVKHDDYAVSKVYFESVPGFFVTGNLYRPIGEG